MVNTNSPTDASTAAAPVIGRDMGPFGRAFRFVSGVCGLILLYFRLPWDEGAAAYLGMMAVYLVLIAGAYIAVFGLLRERILGRVSPWIPAGLFQAPILIYPFGLGTGPLHDALALYTAGSLLVNTFSGYAGLEVAALPSLVWRRRYPIYSPFNGVDLAERSMREGLAAHSGTARLPWIGATLVTAFVFCAFWLIDYIAFMPFLQENGVGPALRLPGPVAVVLLASAALVAWDARARRDRGQGVAALVLVLLTPAFAVDMVPEVLWIAVIAGGLGVAVFTGVRALVRRAGSAHA
ncbi:DUF6410 domain-containing protein [Nocardiopsis sp. NPDC050513]|uniref:DUF6410 domain-containing protein n=1 Tax=Nocardiopsis sp. NPDC050513 TaxID=3364338 RepID=UPI0037B1FE02